jgi:hypothetical protein
MGKDKVLEQLVAIVAEMRELCAVPGRIRF